MSHTTFQAPQETKAIVLGKYLLMWESVHKVANKI